MITFTHILCPIDLSEASVRALTYATALANWYGARLEVLHVTRPPEPPTIAADGVVVEPGRAVSSEPVVAEMHRVLAQVGASAVTPELLVAGGRTHEVIVERAAAHAVDLIVMGTHGRSGFNRLLLGSVTERLLRVAPCPVLTVSAAAPAATASAVSFKRILCPIDFSPASLGALACALSLARAAGGGVTVLHAIEYLDPEEPCEHVDFDIRQRREHFVEHARARLHALVAAEDTTWCDISEVVAVGRAYQMTLQHAAAWPADLICMGAQGTGGLELMLYGSNTQHVLRTAGCPVLTVRP
jgi:nucleotide-binding universal stress UspA family protein